MILGMHRSGTSALTRVINLMGADLGSEMIAVGDDNPHGFWEHRNACALHELLLTELGSSWHDVRALPVGWQESVFAQNARASIRQLITDEFSEKTLWAIKDPRMCRLVPLWIDVLRELDIRPVTVLALRHPKEVGASLHKRNHLTKQHAYLMWAQHEIEAFSSVINLPQVIIDYNDLLESPTGVLAKISAQLDIQWPTPMDEAIGPIRDFLLHDEKHHHRSHFSDDVELSAGWAIDKIYNLISAPDSKPTLHPLYKNYNYLAPLYSEEIDSLTAELKKCSEAIQEHSRINDGLQHEISNLGIERQTAIANCEAMERQRSDFERERDELSIQLAAAQGELDSVSRVLSDTRTELGQIKAASQRIRWLAKRIWLRIIGR